MSIWLAIAGGGALGAMLRFGLGRWVQGSAALAFPVGTLAVNVLGSLAMGLLYVWALERAAWAPEVRLFLFTGILGGFTTFSAFSLETIMLMEEGMAARAALNVLLSVVLCLGAAWVGLQLARHA